MAVNRFLCATALALMIPLATQPAQAGQVENACLASPRSGGDRDLCRCIQRIADQILTRRDQRVAAGFFADPHRAQETRTSDRSSDERFWTRYRQFGMVAQQSCR